jgi:uncharacterized membrane protein
VGPLGHCAGPCLGGFFDGILLHQILQWHHLLSLVPGADSIPSKCSGTAISTPSCMRSLLSAYRIYGDREKLLESWGRALLGALLIGFGIWHVLDSVLSHWLLGIHRTKLDSPNPLLWDIIRYTAFGFLPLLVGWLLLRRRRATSGGLWGSTDAVLLIGLLTAGLAAWSLRAPANQPFTTIVFAPGGNAAEAMNALVAADARLV